MRKRFLDFHRRIFSDVHFYGRITFYVLKKKIVSTNMHIERENALKKNHDKLNAKIHTSMVSRSYFWHVINACLNGDFDKLLYSVYVVCCTEIILKKTSKTIQSHTPGE